MAAGPDVRPAIAVVKRTFGEGVRFHPHLHTLGAGGDGIAAVPGTRCLPGIAARSVDSSMGS